MKRENKIEIGKFVKCLREKKGLSQKELAEELHISLLRLINFEEGYFIVDGELFEKICNLFNVDIHELLNGHYGMSMDERNSATLLALDYYRHTKKVIVVSYSIVTFILVFILLIFLLYNY